MKAERLEKCAWCLRCDVLASTWEQKTLSGVWNPLCRRCAGIRLRNPYNALLGMRKREVPAPDHVVDANKLVPER